MYEYFLGYARIEIATQVLSESQNTSIGVYQLQSC
jgi:hypothetical protein